jgi:hypothetical protein
VQVPRELKHALQQRADAHDVTLSHLVRGVMTAWVRAESRRRRADAVVTHDAALAIREEQAS